MRFFVYLLFVEGKQQRKKNRRLFCPKYNCFALSTMPCKVCDRTQELRESRGDRPGFSSLISLLFLWT